MIRLQSKTRRLTVAALALAAVSALAGSTVASPALIRPQSIIVNPVPPRDLRVSVSVDRSSYRIGEPIQVRVRVAQDAYVYLFSVHPDGVINIVLPNDLEGGANFMRAGETRSFPDYGAPYSFTVGGPAGTDQVLAVATRQPLYLDSFVSFGRPDGFGYVTLRAANLGQAQLYLGQALALVVRPVPQNDWATAVTSYRVRY